MGEQRFVSLGMNEFGEICVVGFTMRDEKICIITAWFADGQKGNCMNKDDIFEQMIQDESFVSAKQATQIPALNAIRQKHYQNKTAHSQLLDEDVLVWLDNQDSNTKAHISAVIRHFMAMQSNLIYQS